MQGLKRTDRAELRLSATLLYVGLWFFVVVGLFHPAHAPANDHPAWSVVTFSSGA
jgi:hypothetical protein